jgi:hypothetical protein
MVEMKRYLIAGVCFFAGLAGASAQGRTVIAGLERHAEYRELIAGEETLVKRADSLAGVVASLRGRLRTDTLNRAALSSAIVGLEEQGFEIRSVMAKLAARINTLEQEWILANLAGGGAGEAGGSGDDPASGQPAFGSRTEPGEFTFASWFATGLSADQMAELRGARRSEGAIPDLVERYRLDHQRLAALVRAHDAAQTQPAADSLAALFASLRAENHARLRQIAEIWEVVFDSKSYLYNLLADKHNRADLLARFEEGLARMREQVPAAVETGAPVPLVDQLLQRRMMADYEAALAAALGDGPAADSLAAVAAGLPGPLSLAGLEPVTLRERLWLDYADVTIGKSPYNASNPIPEVAVWPRGIIWRVAVGNFAGRQSPTVFRGAHPLAVARGEDDRWRYYVGGFPTDSLADAAVEQLRKAGFRAPVPVVWMDGTFIDPAAQEETRIYRIDITGHTELPDAVREAIAAATGDETPDIVRGAEGFTVTPLAAKSAIALRSILEAISSTHPEIEAKLSKNLE